LKMQDALFNWLQIKTVSDARPDDAAAKETLEFFAEILRDDHHLSQFHIKQADDTMYYVQYESDGKVKTQMYEREAVDQLLLDINANPKYNE
jgi:hypothetical protein